MKRAKLIILASDNGRDNWAMVPPFEVPEWVKTPENIGKMMRGVDCMKADEGDKGSKWYRAIRLSDYRHIIKQEQRAQRKAKRQLH